MQCHFNCLWNACIITHATEHSHNSSVCLYVLSDFSDTKCPIHLVGKWSNALSILCSSGRLSYRYPYRYVYNPGPPQAYEQTRLLPLVNGVIPVSVMILFKSPIFHLNEIREKGKSRVIFYAWLQMWCISPDVNSTRTHATLGQPKISNLNGLTTNQTQT